MLHSWFCIARVLYEKTALKLVKKSVYLVPYYVKQSDQKEDPINYYWTSNRYVHFHSIMVSCTFIAYKLCVNILKVRQSLSLLVLFR